MTVLGSRIVEEVERTAGVLCELCTKLLYVVQGFARRLSTKALIKYWPAANLKRKCFGMLPVLLSQTSRRVTKFD